MTALPSQCMLDFNHLADTISCRRTPQSEPTHEKIGLASNHPICSEHACILESPVVVLRFWGNRVFPDSKLVILHEIIGHEISANI
jgi:hypothetical protein